MPLGMRPRIWQGIAIIVLLCSTAFSLSGLAPANAFLSQLSLTTCCSKLEFVVIDSASSCAVFYTLSSLHLLDEELIIVCEIVFFFNDSKHATGVTLGVAHA